MVTIIPILISSFGTVTKGLLKDLVHLKSWGPSGNHANNSIIEKRPEYWEESL